MNGLAPVLAAVALATLPSVSCATVFKGTTQVVHITSEPPGAWVVDEGTAGRFTTPAEIKMSKRAMHVLTISKPGYGGQVVALRRDTNVGWWIVDAFTLGIGNGIDAATGALFDIHPPRVHVVLEPERAPE